MKCRQRREGLVLGLLVFLALGTQDSRAAAADWKVGLAEVKITPEWPVLMAGYASRNKPSTGVTSDLFAKALALEDRTGTVAVIVTTDLIGLQAAVAEPVCRRIEERSGLHRPQILLNSSHIHTGPALSLSPRAHQSAAAGEWQRTIAYTRALQDQLVDVVLKALAHREPARLSWGWGVANFVMNRREFTPRGVIRGVNPRGLADRTVPVLRIDHADGRPWAILFGAGTHNTTLTEHCYEICGDYAGFAQSYVQEHCPGVQSLFMIGFAGDSNPYPRGPMALARQHGRELGREVWRVWKGKMAPVRGPLKVAFDRVALPLQKPPPRTEIEQAAVRGGGVDRWIAEQMLAVLRRGEKLPTSYICPVAVWQFGSDLTLVGLSGEVVVDYARLLEKSLGPNRLWLAGYCNDVFGYVPSARVLSEGGYETRGLYLGGIGRFDPGVEKVLVAKVTELAERVRRP